MSDILNPVSEAEETLSFDVPSNQPTREGKYYFAKGKYPARCVDVASGMTKPKEGAEKGDPKVVFTFLLLSGPGAGTDYKLHCPITASSFWKLEKTAEAFGITLPKGSMKLDLPRAKIIGADVTLDLNQSNFNGKDRMEIKAVLKAEQAASTLPL
jgi:hypothetical protein